MNVGKVVFAKEEIEFLGQALPPKGFKSQGRTIAAFREPSSHKELRAVLSLVIYGSKFNATRAILCALLKDC